MMKNTEQAMTNGNTGCYADESRKLMKHRATGKFAARCVCGLTTLPEMFTTASTAIMELETLHCQEWRVACGS